MNNIYNRYIWLLHTVYQERKVTFERLCEMGSLDSSPYMYWWSGSMRSDDCYKGGGRAGS